MEFRLLRKKYPCFIYKSYNWKIREGDLIISFDFFIEPDIFFKPEITVKNIDKERISSLKKEIIDNLVFHLGLIELLSYWKTTCSQNIIIKIGNLSKEQIKWWKNLLIKGMAQFFYENKIDWRDKNFLKIMSRGEIPRAVSGAFLKNRILVGVGGGKDSVVTLELLKKSKKTITPFILNPIKSSLEIVKISKLKNLIIVERKIDKKLLELNKKGFLNGHTPFSAYLAFLGILLGYIFDCKYIVFSNERSSNEGNVKYFGRTINHQYSKSFEFEKKFRQYCQKYLIKDIEYFSFLRPLYEIQIAKIFSRYSKYFKAFLSCNEGQKTFSGAKTPTQQWCGACPKCLFTFVILFPFLRKEEIIRIFGRNLFDNKNLIPLMEELLGYKNFKPFECVGTKQESLAAFYLCLKKYEKEKKELPVLLKYFKKNILPKEKNIAKETKKVLNSWDSHNFLNQDFKKFQNYVAI
jgi:hypothetical protein